jgi:hypothetical protein
MSSPDFGKMMASPEFQKLSISGDFGKMLASPDFQARGSYSRR